MPWPSAIALATLFVVAGTLVAVLSKRLGGGSVGPNHGMGLRLPSTFRSDEAWHAGQRAFAPFGIAGGVGTAVLGASLLLRPGQGLAITIASAAAIWLVVLPGIGAFMGDLAAKEA
jgi:uncharacterized membrane protein